MAMLVLLTELGHPDADATFIQLMFKRPLGISLSRVADDNLAVAVFVLIVIATTVGWIREWRRSR